MPQPASSWDDVLAGVADAGQQEQDTATAGAGAIEKPSAGSWWKVPAYLGSKVLSGAEGMLGLPGTVLGAADDLQGRAYNALVPWGIKSGTTEAANFNQQSRAQAPFLNASQMQAGTDALGITNNKKLEEGRGLTTRLVGGAAEALPAAGVDLATGGALTPALATAGAAGLTAQTAHEFAPGSSWAPLLAGIAGGYGAGKITENITKALDYRALGKAVKSTADEAAAADLSLQQLRDAKTPAGYKADDLFRDRVGASEADLNLFNAKAVAGRDTIHKTLDSQIEGVAGTLAPSQTLEDAGEAAQAGARTWLGTTLPKKISALWAPVDKAIPADTLVDLKNFRNALSAINKSAGELEPLAGSVKPRTPAVWEKALGDIDEDLEAGGKVAKQFTWQDVAKFRTALGDAMSNPSVLKDVGQQNLSRLYATLTGDMKAAAKANGAEDLFNAANTGSTKLYGTAETTFGKLVRNKVPEPTDPMPGKSVDSLLRAGQRDSSDLSALREEVPEIADHLAAVALRTPGQWSKLSADSKAALIPDAEKRSLIDFSLKAKDDAASAADDAMATAKANHKENIKLAAAEKTGTKRGLELGFQSARTAAEAAAARAKSTAEAYKAASTSQPNITGAFRDFMHGAVGGGVGHSVISYGGDMLNALGVHTDMSPRSAAVLGATLGYLVPKIASGSKNMLVDAATNPASRRATAVGATAGSFWQPQPTDSSNSLTGR